MRRTVITLITGAFLGATLLGGAKAAVDTISAQRSSQPIYVDGEKVELEAYNIAGSNYVKLRDVGKAIGFDVNYDAATNSVYIGEPPKQEEKTSDRVVTLPTDGSKFVPQVGDLIPCDDGTLYEVKDVSRWESNAAMDGPMPAMPTPTCDWNLFPETPLPKVEAKHYSNKYGEDLFVTNLYELRRMEYTIRNALGKEPDAWRGKELLAKINLTIPPEYEPYTATFWPWRESELTDLVHALPNVRYYIAAYDYYHNGVFQYTRYCAMSI